MKTYKVQASIRKQVFALQALLSERLTIRGISDDSGLDKMTVQTLMVGREALYTQQTMKALLEYFNNRGLPTTPNDLYIITVTADNQDEVAEPLLLLDKPVAPVSQPPTPEHPRRSRLIKRDQRDRHQKRKEAQAAQESSRQALPAAS